MSSNTIIIEKSITFAQGIMRKMHSSHGWDHIERVVVLAEKIASQEKTANPFIVKTAAILHDIARLDEDRSGGQICHAELGSEKAYDFLISEGLDHTRAEHIRNCIVTHRFRNNKAPASLEAKILYDADKLDSIGAVGIGRAFLFSGEIGARLHNSNCTDIGSTHAYTEEDTAYREYMVKLKYVRDKMLTTHGVRFAEERSSFMEEFFSRLHNEVKGVW
ncbi:MAG: HD domain-containing protein [bacterium]|nr:HD domain-containing protein [bacterium]